MSVTVILAVFPLIFVGELPDKTALAALVMGSRYRASWVFSGMAAAFLMHVVIAVALGRLLSLAPHRVVELVVGLLFLLGAGLLWRESGRQEEQEEQAEADVAVELGVKPATFRRVAGTAFGIIAVAEFGDLTQILTANMAAKYDDPVAVGIGAVLALWSVGALAILGGRGLLRLIPLRLITRLAAAVMAALAVVSVVEAVRG
jgi:putative Ca2+/H+ antiporter (TMEM165/GDT1 family)